MSEIQAQGVVEAVAGPNKGGFYSIKVGGEFYGFEKKEAPSVSKGDTVRFDFYLKSGKYKTIKGPIQKKAGPPAAVSSGGGSRDDYWLAKDKYEKEVKEPRIVYFAAYERALLFVDLAIRSGCYKALEKAKDPDKLGILEAFVDETTQRLVQESDPTSGDPTPEGEPSGGDEPIRPDGTAEEEWT